MSFNDLMPGHIPQFNDHNGHFYILQIPHSLKPNEIDKFNGALHLLMLNLHKLFTSNSFFDNNGIPIFIINTNAKKIGDFSYIFDLDHLFQWSNSMRNLLFNLKFLQTALLYRAVSSNNINSNKT